MYFHTSVCVAGLKVYLSSIVSAYLNVPCAVVVTQCCVLNMKQDKGRKLASTLSPNDKMRPVLEAVIELANALMGV